MPRIVVLKSSDGSDVFNWNIDANVGLNSLNKQVDFELVQFGYFAESQDARVPQESRTIFANVVPGSRYTGGASDPLTLAILEHQKIHGGTQDGHISVIRGSTGFYNAASTFLLVGLNASMRALLGSNFPRIDSHAKCPPTLKAAVARCFDIPK